VSFVAQGCAASGSADSEACRCLDDDTCLNEAVADPDCAPKFAAAQAAAEAQASLAPLADYARDYGHCTEAGAVAAAREATCQAVSEAAGTDAGKLAAFVAGMGTCAQVADVRDRLRQAECGAAWARVEGSPGDDALLASFLSDRQACSETEAAVRELERRVNAAWAAAQSEEEGLSYGAATARLDTVLETFGTHLGEAQRARIEAKLSRLQTLLVETQCAAALNQAKRSGRGTELTRFVADNPACTAEAEAARALLAECIAPYEQALATATPEALRAFARQTIDQCPQQAAMAAEAAEGAEEEARRARLQAQRAEEAARRVALEAQRVEEERRAEAALLTGRALDGVYDGQRGYTDPGRRSKTRYCLSRYRFTATVRDGRISFESDGRNWHGSVATSGRITIDDVQPPFKDPTEIQARIDPQTGEAEGSLWNAYCGNGYFELTRR
jgi:hypothetical protein